MSSTVSQASEATSAEAEIQPCSEVLKQTSLELPTYLRPSSSFKSPRHSSSPKNFTDLTSVNDKTIHDKMDADPLPDDEIRPLLSPPSADANSVVGVVIDAGVTRPSKMSIFSVPYGRPRKEKRDKLTESKFSSSDDFLLWAWGGSRHSGVICMAFSSFIYSIMGLLVENFAVTEVPSSETIFIRCAVILVAAFIWIRKTGQPLLGLPHVRGLLVARTIAGYLSLLGFFYSIQVLPLHDAIVLNFTTPFMAAILGRIILQEKWGVIEIGGTVCSFLGVFLIFYPVPLLQGQTPESKASTGLYKPGEQNYIHAILITLLSAASGGANYCFIRAAAKASEQPMITVFAFAAFACPVAATCMFSFQKFVVPDIFAFIAMIIIALLAFVAEVLLARGLQLEKACRATSILLLHHMSYNLCS
ncbi:uncharacterized protein LOC131034649 isoform X2 [Cryptomeria japonica]|uniref:uncharacterized protein LOC131034649 isoform X2 n=1 Tax=Cryptomeria japonica TaxID=3369 RepID=UPI0027D9EE69|nr:uncharacterized protein LOC131034649 isoform X2 [Cryptomeria japonica]